jgi:hypothetical protein
MPSALAITFLARIHDGGVDPDKALVSLLSRRQSCKLRWAVNDNQMTNNQMTVTGAGNETSGLADFTGRLLGGLRW